jgi:hypothetical protein
MRNPVKASLILVGDARRQPVLINLLRGGDVLRRRAEVRAILLTPLRIGVELVVEDDDGQLFNSGPARAANRARGPMKARQTSIVDEDEATALASLC